MLAWGYNKNVKPRKFVAGDLVLWKVVGNMKDQSVGKLAPNWERPYQVMAVVRTRAYYMEDMEERPFSRLWNVYNLKKYYP